MRKFIYSTLLGFGMLCTQGFAQGVANPATSTTSGGTPGTGAPGQAADVNRPSQTSDKVSDAPVTTPGTETLSDAQIGGILKLANDGEIKMGKLASKNAKSKQIKDFAQQMVTDHNLANKDLKALSSKLRIKEADSELKRNLQATASASEARIKGLKGAEFDKAYIDEKVTLHQMVLDTIDQKLLPSATAPDVKAHLEKVRPVVSKHLDHAKTLQGTTGGAG